MMNNNQSPRVVKYHDDKYDYIYSDFWKDRNYDHNSELIVLKRYFNKYIKGRNFPWIIDIGGNFGRLIPLYAVYLNQVTILDYADNQFHLAQQTAKEYKIKLNLLAGNAYYLPFRNQSQKALISVRVVHHLENPEIFFKEVDRVLHPEGVFIFQASNKNHIRLLLRSLMKFDFTEWKKDYNDLVESGLKADGSFILIRNYKASYLENLIKKQNLKIVRKRSVSWLRTFRWMRTHYRIGLFFERILQFIGIIFPVSANNWYVIKKLNSSNFKSLKSGENQDFMNTLYSHTDKNKLSKKTCIQFLKTNKNGVKYLDFRE